MSSSNTNDPLRIWHPEVWHTEAFVYLFFTVIVAFAVLKFALAPVPRRHSD